MASPTQLLLTALSHIRLLFPFLRPQKFYSRLLARRLITGSSVSEYAETTMISGLKQICGFEYVNKLSRMFTDITISAEMNDSFKEYCASRSTGLKFDFSIQVLTSGYWPLQVSSGVIDSTRGQHLINTFPPLFKVSPGTASVRFPTEVAAVAGTFSEFYGSKHQGRKLQWLHHLGKGELRCNSMRRPYEFSMTSFQMAALIALNDADEVDAEAVESATGMPVSEAEKTLKSLVDSKILIAVAGKPSFKVRELSLPPPSFDVNQSTHNQHQVNASYSSKRLKVKVNAPMAMGAASAAAKEESGATYKGVEEDRKLYLQAAIVRVMKSRKELKHVQLVQEVISQAQSRFTPSVTLIKKCIETLIEKEFLRRVEGQSDKYAYVA